MRTRRLILLGAVSASVLFAVTAPDVQITKQEILKLMPLGVDLDEKWQANYLKLLSYGDRIYPQLHQIADETTDPRVESVIIAIVADGTGDKTVGRLAVKRILTRNLRVENVDGETIRNQAVIVLGKVGTSEDVDTVLSVLEESDERLRINAIRALARLGDAKSKDRISIALDRHASRAELGVEQRERAIREAKVAMKAIDARIETGASNER
jgi:hypothetical protein